MHLLSKIIVAGAMNNIFWPKNSNINAHNPGLSNCQAKQICVLK